MERSLTVGETNALTNATTALLSDIILKMAATDSVKAQQNATLSALSVLSLKIETLRQFNFSILRKTQQSTLFIT